MTDILTLEQRTLVHNSAVRLHGEFAGVFSEETVEYILADSLQRQLATARVAAFVPLFAER
ncbi:hypothetical protein BH20ACT7_BH20ACT7_00310 [soil metagenome]|jgi:hypothetical protein